MTDALSNLVLGRLPIVGLAAYSISLPDRVLVTQCLSKSLNASATEEMLDGVVRSGRTLLPINKAAARYCWTFESLRIYVTARADGICLALVVGNQPGIQMVRIQEMMQDFAELPADQN
jgi:hypothetical protein